MRAAGDYGTTLALNSKGRRIKTHEIHLNGLEDVNSGYQVDILEVSII